MGKFIDWLLEPEPQEKLLIDEQQRQNQLRNDALGAIDQHKNFDPINAVAQLKPVDDYLNKPPELIQKEFDAQAMAQLGDKARANQLGLFDRYSQVPETQSYLQSQGLGVDPLTNDGKIHRSAAIAEMQLKTDEDVQLALDQIDDALTNKLITKEAAGGLRREAIKRPFTVIDRINDLSLMVGGKVKTEEMVRPEKVETVKQTTEARNMAPEKATAKNMDELLSMRTQYANLSDASKNFNSKFFTPYIGKIRKLYELRALDPKFQDFLQPLGLALNEYRRQNFGTAQTNTEIQNFLDVINTDLNVTPEAFQKQLDGLLYRVKRDYEDKVSGLQGNKTVVPQNYQSVNMQNQVDERSMRIQNIKDRVRQLRGQ